MKLKSTIILISISIYFMGFFTDDVKLHRPVYFPDFKYDFNKNPLSEGKIALGRALFYDPILSRDGTISCASCHSPFNAFAHTDHDLSHGFNDSIGTRNAPALFNLAWQNHFMWDGAINHLDMQALAPISHPGEMGESISNVVYKLQHTTLYPPLFYEAFCDSVITGEFLLKALSQFQLTLISANSKYDKMKRGEIEFSEQEIKGYNLFKQNCNSCHAEPLFSTYDFAFNNLPVDPVLRDFGRSMITHQAVDSLLFKIPSLRNLQYTYPYMHDGRFDHLNQVLAHYENTVVLQKAGDKRIPKSIHLSSIDKIDLSTFLLTLNDDDFVLNKKHQFPRDILLSNN